MLEVSTALSQKHDRFGCLENCGQFDTAHETIGYRNISMPSDTLEVEQYLGAKYNPLTLSHQILPNIPLDTELSHLTTSPFETVEGIQDQASVACPAALWYESQPYESMVRRHPANIFDMPVSPRNISYCDEPASRSSTLRSKDIDSNATTMDANALCGYHDSTQPTLEFGPVDWWASTNLQPTTPYFPTQPATDSTNWNYPDASVVQSNMPICYSILSVTPPPTNVESYFGLTSSISEETICRHSITSSDDGPEVNQEHAPPHRKRKSSKDDAVSAHQMLKKPALQRHHSNVPETQPPSVRRERHRRASARNWQKQKQQSADLESARDTAEARNQELHREYSQILDQVMNLKNALMDHAECNHPAINGWLRCQAANYALTKGGSVDIGWNGESESGAGEVSMTAYNSGWARTPCA
ncbi:hypothetical protein CSAL01_05035 [Colletotrichum salicis]|uniref:BZIP domain-containing protein n=1 Tax=Colletotrichum salicis TaxID=1209931 RepID=A0A135S2S3_9PEZI|nr:hypothetical protein CSAL01_05035 [Colletotrichum salicis]